MITSNLFSRMDAKEIAAVLQDIGVLLELKGENAFKVRAYQSGARALESLEEDLGTLIEDGRLADVNGIGKALTEKIETLYREGALPYYEELKESVPNGLIEMLDIPGFGPKKIKKVHDALGVNDIAGLTAACEAGEIAELPGFGKKSEEKILSGIKNREAYGRRHLWWNAHEKAMPILDGLRKLKEVIRAEAAGSLRRGRETVGDLDFIVSADKPWPVMEWFTSLDGVSEVSAKGETKSSIRLEGGLQADLRVVPDSRFVFALHHFTGSKDHNVKMRQRALSQGYSLSEWGIFRKGEDPEDDDVKPFDRPLAIDGIKEERHLFEALGLNWIPPELREGLDELEMAEENALPDLIDDSVINGVFHNHTTASDGHATLKEMAEAAADHGWSFIGVADHSQASFQANGIDEERLRKQVREIRELNESGKVEAHVFAGCEVDILRDGKLDFDKTVLQELDYCVLSVHSSMSGQTEEEMTRRIITAMETDTGCAKMLGHLTGRLLLRREGYAVNVHKVIDAAAANEVLIELNANPHRLDMDWRYWRTARDQGVLCVINPDAHNVEGLEYTHAGVLTARKGGLVPNDVFNTKSLNEVQDWFARCKG